jgi:hypothetical protein
MRRGLLVLLPVDLGAEIADAHPEPSQQPHHGMPAHAAAAVLDLGHVRDVDPRSRRQRFLGERGPMAQGTQCATDRAVVVGGVIDVCRLVVHYAM